MGYKYQQVSAHGKLLVRDEPLASIIQEGLECYASGRFETQAEVKHFFETRPDFPKDFEDGTICFEKVIRLLTRVIYSGHIEIPDWDVPLRKGHHAPIVSLETFEAIKERIKSKARAPFRKDINADFPLRGFACCDECGTPLTTCWSTSKSGKKHPYCLRRKKTCPSYRKSIRQDVLEGEIAEVMKGLQPSEGLFAVAKRMFKDAWTHRIRKSMANKAALIKDRKTADEQIHALLDRIVEAESTSVIAAFEKRIDALEREKQVLDEKRAN